MTPMELISRKEAREQGLTRYFTGKPCKNGHTSERFVSNKTCCACITERGQQAEVKKQKAATNSAWNAANKKRRSATGAAWQAANKDRKSAYDAAWAAANPATKAALCAQRRAAKLQRTPKWADRSAIKAIYEHAAFMTRVCNEPFHVDHFYPLQGETVSGLHVPANLRIITATENVRKSNKMPDEHFLQ